jgi:site-specific DNA-methyltransferase (adenine-specific)
MQEVIVRNSIILGDSLEIMKEMDDNSVDFIVTDPPYGLKFMGKRWDYEIPGSEFWIEMLRLLKPGGHLLAMGGTRTFHRLATKIEDSGFEIRDCIMWLYGSGFPKSHNFGKGKMDQFEGYGTALKPAYEPIIMAMKPLDGTYMLNAEKWGVAGINIDESRVGTNGGTEKENTKKNESVSCFGNGLNGGVVKEINKGRWPANLILSSEAAEMLDEQTGILKSGEVKPYKRSTGGGYHGNFPDHTEYFPSNQGGASRFFYCPKVSSAERNRGLEDMPLKVSSGCYGEFVGDGRGRQTEHQPQKNNHPTVKPLELMKYLIRLIAPPGKPVLLDPFCGSGSTCLAARILGIDYIGIEMNPEYHEIAVKRCAQVVQTEMNI